MNGAGGTSCILTWSPDVEVKAEVEAEVEVEVGTEVGDGGGAGGGRVTH